MSGESHERHMLDIDTSLLANLIRFYDRPLGASLLEPALSRRARAGSRDCASY